MVELVSIAGLVTTVISGLVGVWLGYQLRERSAKKDWRRHRLSEQAREVRGFVRLCLRFAQDLSSLKEGELSDDGEYKAWLRTELALLDRVSQEVPFGAGVLVLYVDDSRLSALLQEIIVIARRFTRHLAGEEFEHKRAAPAWGKEELKRMRSLAKKVETRFGELVDDL